MENLSYLSYLLYLQMSYLFIEYQPSLKRLDFYSQEIFILS